MVANQLFDIDALRVWSAFNVTNHNSLLVNFLELQFLVYWFSMIQIPTDFYDISMGLPFPCMFGDNADICVCTL